MPKIDMKLLKEHLRTAAINARDAKRPFRESGQPNLTWSDWRHRTEMKERATLLCSIRAHLRGRCGYSPDFDDEHTVAEDGPRSESGGLKLVK